LIRKTAVLPLSSPCFTILVLHHAPLENMTPFPRPPLFIFAVVSITLLGGCDTVGNDDADTDLAEAIIVANGGNFSDQNGSLTLYDPESGTVTQSQTRAGFVQGVLATEEGLVTLINTFEEGRIDVLDPVDGTLKAQYKDIDNPRDAVSVDGVLWVTTSTFGQPGHLLAFGVGGEAQSVTAVGSVPEGVVQWADRMVVANNGSLGSGKTLNVVAPSGQESVSVEAGCEGPRDLYAASVLIVVCSGKTVYNADFTAVIEQTPGRVVFLDEQFQIEQTIVLPDQAGSTNGTETAYFSAATQELFVTLSASEQIVVIDVESRRVTRVHDLSGHPTLLGLSGIAYDAGRDALYVGRFPQSSAGPFPDYAAAGTVTVLNSEGDQIDAFAAGIAISSITIQ
jgi:hypothetical protein